jgi:hypothetical protein
LEYLPRLCSRANSETTPHTSRPFSDPAVSLSATSDLNVARTSRANVLVVGPQQLVKNVVKLMAPATRRDGPVQSQGGQLRLPSSSLQRSTVVVQDIDALTAAEQRQLLEWIDVSNTFTQVISTASIPLLPRVEACTFNETLYYRLNTIYIDLFDE